eukprot:COSAG01_NODE_3904_length_5560_cov_7.746383_3_plen_108_part_00
MLVNGAVWLASTVSKQRRELVRPRHDIRCTIGLRTVGERDVDADRKRIAIRPYQPLGKVVEVGGGVSVPALRQKRLLMARRGGSKALTDARERRARAAPQWQPFLTW